MSTENEAEGAKSGERTEQAQRPGPEAIERFARYTAPAMLAMLAAGGHSTPVIAQTAA